MQLRINVENCDSVHILVPTGLYENASKNIREPDQHRVHTMDVMLANGAFQRREMNMINESGLYTLIFKSRKAAAERFQQWVTCDVLPSIRKTGSYGTVKARSSDYSILFRMFNMYHQCTYTALRNAYQVVITQFCRERGFDVPDFTARANDAQGELL